MKDRIDNFREVPDPAVEQHRGTLKMLTLQQVRQIDEALALLGPFGEIRLIKERGLLRFIDKLDSESLSGF